MRRHTSYTAKFAWMALPITAMLMLGGCSAKEESVKPGSVSFNTQKLSGPIDGKPLIEVVGSYGPACLNRTGLWSVPAGGYVGALENTDLSVIKNNTTCTLKITRLIFDSDPGVGVTKEGFDIVSPAELSLAATYASPVAFADAVDLADNPDFYATAKLVDLNPGTDLNYDSNMTLYIKASSDVATLTQIVDSSFATVGVINVVYENVPVPNYTLDVLLDLQVDTNMIVQNTSTGSLQFTAGVPAGQRYIVLDGPISMTSQDAVKTAFNAGSPIAVPGPVVDITVSDLGLVGQTLPKEKYVIFENASDGIQSFRMFKFTFVTPL